METPVSLWCATLFKQSFSLNIYLIITLLSMLNFPCFPLGITYRTTLTWKDGFAHPFLAFSIYSMIDIILHGFPCTLTLVGLWHPFYYILLMIGSLYILHPRVEPHTSILIMLIALPLRLPHYWLVYHLLDYHTSQSLHFIHTMTILHFYATIHPPSRRLSLMPLPLIVAIFSFHLQHYNHLVACWGIYLLVSSLFAHLVSSRIPFGYYVYRHIVYIL
jgi:hypothetical protein